MHIDEKTLDRYEKLLRLEERGATEGEKSAARQARIKMEEKNPSIVHYFTSSPPPPEPSSPPWEDEQAAWGWDRVADVAGSFFSQMKDYAEFAWGLSFARGMADRVTIAIRRNTSGSVTLNTRIEPNEIGHLSQFTPEQRAAFAQAMAEKMYNTILERF